MPHMQGDLQLRMKHLLLVMLHLLPDATRTFCKVVGGKMCDTIHAGPGRRFGIEDDSFKKLLTLTLRQVSKGDSGVYRCEFCFNGEQVPFKTITFWGLSNIGYEGGEVEFKCTYAHGFQTKAKYFYKKDAASTSVLIQTEGGQTSSVNGRVSLQDATNARGFTVTLRELTAEDSGKYSCGMRRGPSERHHHLSERILVIKSLSTVKGDEGATVVVKCQYQNKEKWRGHKHFCRGKDPVKCLEEGSLSGDRFTLRDSATATARVFTVTITDLRAEDAGVYWCVEFGLAGPEFTSAVDLTVKEGTTHSRKTTTTTATIPLSSWSTSPPGVTGVMDSEPNLAIWLLVPLVMLLLGTGLLLVVKCKKTSRPAPTSPDIPIYTNTAENTQGTGDYVNAGVQEPQANTPTGPMRSNRPYSDPDYQNSNMSNTTTYQTLITSTCQNDSTYHTLHPRTNLQASLPHSPPQN